MDHPNKYSFLANSASTGSRRRGLGDRFFVDETKFVVICFVLSFFAYVHKDVDGFVPGSIPDVHNNYGN